jgi:hypothetical protein
MSRPTKFDIMRAHRRQQAHHTLMYALREEAHALGYDDSEMVVEALLELDARRWNDANKKTPVRRWWWPLQRVAAALRPRNNLER